MRFAFPPYVAVPSPFNSSRRRARNARYCPCRPCRVEPETLHVQVLGARQREAPIGRVRGVIDVQRFAAAVAREDPIDLEIEHARDRGAPVMPGNLEGNRLVFEAAEIADQIAADHARGAARLAAGEPRESSTLRGVGAGIDDYRENP